MTVEKLIKELQRYPKRMRVMVDGYEDGYDDPSIVRIHVEKVWENPGYSGQYQNLGAYNKTDGSPFKVVCLSRNEVEKKKNQWELKRRKTNGNNRNNDQKVQYRIS